SLMLHPTPTTILPPSPTPPLSPYTTLFRSLVANQQSYERGLDDLKLVCDGYIEDLRRQMPCEPIGKYITECNERNDRCLTLEHRSEEHTSELQSRFDLVCRLLLEKKTSTGH